MHPIKKQELKISFTFYISVPNFRALGSIIIFFKTDLVPLKVLKS